jgi:hypothetical protein
MGGEHGEAFPRAETRELVGEALRAERRRAWVQDLLIALALALLALGLPLERLLGRGARFGERTSFLVSALCFALGWLVLMRAARRNGWESGAALRASLIAASAPVAVFAATTPGLAAAGWLGACLVLTTLASEEAPAPVRALAWLAASVLHPWNLWLWPAWLLRERRGRAWCLAAVLAAGIGLLARFPYRPREFLAGLDGGPGPCVAWWTLWIAGLGGAAVGLIALRRSAPLWLIAFALAPLVPLSLGGTIGFDLPWLWLAPLGWLGALELEKRGRRTGLLLAGSIACAAAALVWVRATDPERAWRADAEQRLEPNDLVLTHSPAHHYLLATRHGLAVCVLPARWVPGPQTADLERAVFDARGRGQRIVLDEDSLGREGDRLCDEATFEWATRAADLRLRAR